MLTKRKDGAMTTDSQESEEGKVTKARAQRIRDARAQARLTQQALADKTGASKAMVAQWETGIRRPGVDSLWSLSRTLGVSFSWLAIGESQSESLDPDIIRRINEPKYNSHLLMACVEMVLAFIVENNIPLVASNLPSLADDLYQRAVNQGLDRKDFSRDEMITAVRGLAKIQLAISS
jgi:transcriptional regulator with XRE-family HTH domain